MSNAETVLRDALSAVQALKDPTDEANVEELARRLDLCDMIVEALNGVAVELTTALAESMEEDQMAVLGVGWLMRQELPPSVRRDHESARRDVLAAVQRRVATNPLTGEVTPGAKVIVDEAWSLINDSIGIGGGSFKRKGFARLNLDTDEYQAESPRGWTVKIHREQP